MVWPPKKLFWTTKIPPFRASSLWTATLSSNQYHRQNGPIIYYLPCMRWVVKPILQGTVAILSENLRAYGPLLLAPILQRGRVLNFRGHYTSTLKLASLSCSGSLHWPELPSCSSHLSSVRRFSASSASARLYRSIYSTRTHQGKLNRIDLPF